MLAASRLAWANTVPPDPEMLSKVRTEIQRWLELRGLAPPFELQKLRWIARDDVPLIEWLELDLRFVTLEADSAQALGGFVEVNQRFEQAQGVSLSEALVAKLAHAAGIARADGHVTISILGTRVAAMRDALSGLLVFKPTASNVRMATPVALALDAIAVGGTGSPLPAKGAEGIAALRTRIDTIVATVFALSNSALGLPAPRLDNRGLGEANEVRMDVSGIRKVVIADGDFWERLQISIILSETAQGGVRAMCFVDGSFAAGKGLRVPAANSYTAMLDGYQVDLDRFAARLLREVQQRVAQPAR